MTNNDQALEAQDAIEQIWAELCPDCGPNDLAYIVDSVRILRITADRSRKALENIANDANVLVGGTRILHGNTELPGDTGQFYKGYNAGIDSQHEHCAKIARIALSTESGVTR